MIIVHYLGNEFVKEDSLAIEIVKLIKEKYKKQINFKKIDSFDDLIDFKGKKYFMDVCEGISKVKLIDDLTVFENIRSVTTHDIDFGFFLQLANKLDMLEKIKIICLPQENYNGLKKDVCDYLESLLLEEY